MGLWFLATLLFTVFSGLYFAADKDRLTSQNDYKTEIAGLYDTCRIAAAKEAINPGSTFGTTTTAETKACSAADLPNAGVPGLNVPGVFSLAQTTNINGAPQRALITFIRPTDTVMNVPFNEAKRQIRDNFGKQTTTGILIYKDGIYQVDNGDARAILEMSNFWAGVSPAIVPLGSVVSVNLHTNNVSGGASSPGGGIRFGGPLPPDIICAQGLCGANCEIICPPE